MEKKRCPVCGQPLKKKHIKKSRNYRRAVKSFICADCNYAEYDSGEREQAITDGYMDDELNIFNFNE